MRVALVDDNAQIRELLRNLLESHTPGTVVAEAEDGDVAAQAVSASRADVVIMDYHMPRVDGVEATRRVKLARPSAQVVAYTSTDDRAVAAAFLEAGATRHFDKTAIDELIAYIQTLQPGPVGSTG
jgi:DNA-binding NarL/FixJ family response regulator